MGSRSDGSEASAAMDLPHLTCGSCTDSRRVCFVEAREGDGDRGRAYGGCDDKMMQRRKDDSDREAREEAKGEGGKEADPDRMFLYITV